MNVYFNSKVLSKLLTLTVLLQQFGEVSAATLTQCGLYEPDKTKTNQTNMDFLQYTLELSIYPQL